MLSLQNISKTFYLNGGDQFQALKKVTLTLDEGDFVTIVGGNGAGKSSLLNAVAGTFQTDEGNIFLNGKEVTFLTEEERAREIGRVFQNPSMGTAPRMTVFENLSLAEKRGEYRGLSFSTKPQSREKYQHLLASIGLGLENRLDAEIGNLSGGQRQSVALLMATLKTPKILLLDEHTAALDPKTSQKILEVTDEQVKKHHLTALMITHNLSDAITYGNRLVVMNHGRIVKTFNQDEKKKLTDQSLYQLVGELEMKME